MGDWRKDTQSLLHFSMKHGIMITDNKNRAVLVECYQHSARPPERISGLSIEVFYSSCLYEHDSRENTKRQESSEYPLGSIFYAGRHNRA